MTRPLPPLGRHVSSSFTLLLAIGCPLLLLALERIQAKPGRPWVTPHLLTDAWMGFLRLGLSIALLGGFAIAAMDLIREKLPFLYTGVLDERAPWLQFGVYFVVADFSYYIFHRVMHSTKPLWVFHAVHHSAPQANPLMVNRAHPIEEVLYLMTRAVPPAILGGAPPALLAFIVVDQFWSYFVHSDIKVNPGPLKYLIVTPQYHRVHHSLKRHHFDKNFSGRLIIWDWVFGTMNRRFDEYPEIGLHDYPIVERSRSPWKAAAYACGHMLFPFAALWHHFKPTAGPRAEPAHDKSFESAVP